MSTAELIAVEAADFATLPGLFDLDVDQEHTFTIDGMQFIVTRETPSNMTAMTTRNRIAEVVYSWSLFVVTTDEAAERVEITTSAGMWISRRPEEAPRIESFNRHALERMVNSAKIYAEGVARLSVMLDKLMSEDDLRNATPKARKLRAVGAMALRHGRVCAPPHYHGNIVSLIAGDAVLVVSRDWYPANPDTGAAEHTTAYHELVYRVGDRAVHGAYNLVYTGVITSISPKTITVVDGDETKRLSHEVFARRNNRPIADADKRNASWMD